MGNPNSLLLLLALASVVAKKENKNLDEVLSSVREAVENGKTLSEVFEQRKSDQSDQPETDSQSDQQDVNQVVDEEYSLQEPILVEIESVTDRRVIDFAKAYENFVNEKMSKPYDGKGFRSTIDFLNSLDRELVSITLLYMMSKDE